MRCFPAKSLKLIPHQTGSMETALSSKRKIPCDSIPGRFDLMRFAATSATKKRTTFLCSSLLASIFNADEHTLHYAHLQSNNRTTVWTCAFSICMSPTLQMAVSIRNNSVASLCKVCFMAGVRFSFDCPSNDLCLLKILVLKLTVVEKMYIFC